MACTSCQVVILPHFNPFASGIQKVLLSPITGLFSMKIKKKFLALRFGGRVYTQFLMARNFFRIFTENNPVMGDSKTFGIPEAKELKISLSMIRCPDNQINASFIDISRIKWLVFLLWSSFFRTTSTVASSEAPADYQPAPGRTDGIPERHQRQWIINPSLQICAWNFNRTGRG